MLEVAAGGGDGAMLELRLPEVLGDDLAIDALVCEEVHAALSGIGCHIGPERSGGEL
ncbi:hypothetical protein MELA_01256 [Candidatus Methylomirabilis lanthanidiphila]|uniref:Uncharacterized protein n=1 Tax=Candidatus Methylomirabilis lanthanidiphila TaxID=2211376 RepID=A0A564ZHS6_9BACT|nr:hypothetical protein MELA_01256 [Candidatus Methylomirabilis lanthanidiphila]